MKKLIFLCGIFIAISTAPAGALPLFISPGKGILTKKAPVAEYTFYGYADITFYTNGNPKRIRCRNPKDTICCTITMDSPHTLNTYSGGFSTGTYTVSSYTHTVDPSGEDILDF